MVEQLGGAKQKVSEDRNRDSKPHCDACTMALPVGTESCESSNQNRVNRTRIGEDSWGGSWGVEHLGGVGNRGL